MTWVVFGQSEGGGDGSSTLGGLLGGFLSAVFQWLLDAVVWLIALVLDLIWWALDAGLSLVGWDIDYMTELFTLPQVPQGLQDILPAVNAWVPLAEWWVFAGFYLLCTRQPSCDAYSHQDHSGVNDGDVFSAHRKALRLVGVVASGASDR